MNETRQFGHPLFAICCTSMTLVIFWVNQGVGDERTILKEFKERVLSIQGPYNTDKNGATV